MSILFIAVRTKSSNLPTNELAQALHVCYAQATVRRENGFEMSRGLVKKVLKELAPKLSWRAVPKQRDVAVAPLGRFTEVNPEEPEAS